MQLHPSTWHFLPWLKKLILLWKKNSCCEEKVFLWRKTACFEENLATLFLSPLLLVSRPPPAHICARFYPFHLFLTIMPPPTPSLVTAPLIHLSSQLSHILCDTLYPPFQPPINIMQTSLANKPDRCGPRIPAKWFHPKWVGVYFQGLSKQRLILLQRESSLKSWRFFPNPSFPLLFEVLLAFAE